MSAPEMQAAFIAALLKKDNKRTEVDRYDISNFLRNAGFYHSKLLESISSFASVEICKTDLIIYAQHEMVGLQYWYLLKGEVQLYSSKKARFQYIKSGASMHATRESLAELGKFEYTVNQGDFFGVESFVNSDPHAERSNTAVVTKDGTIILPIQGATPLRHATDFIFFPHQYQVHTLSDWCKIPPELRSDHIVSLILHHLKGFKFFARLADHLGLSWAKMCVLVNVRAQTLLFQQNDPSDSIYFIIDGACQVRIQKLNENIAKSSHSGSINWLTLEADFGECVHTFESGDSFGELSLDHAKPNQVPRRTASIICIRDCVLLRVDAEAYYTLQKMGQSSRIILSQWMKSLQLAAGSRSLEAVEMLSFLMLDFKYFSFMNESTRRVLANDLLLIDAKIGDIIFVEGEPVFQESVIASTDESSIQQKVSSVSRRWATDSVCAILCGSVGAFKKKKAGESSLQALESYIHMSAAQKLEKISDLFGQLQTTMVAGEGFGEDLLHRKSSDVKRNLSYVCLEPCQLLFYGREPFSMALSPTHDLGSGKSKIIMRKSAEQRTHRDMCVIFRELAGLPFIQNFVEQDFHDFLSKAKFGSCPAFAVINNKFPKHIFGIVLSGAMSVHQSDEQESVQNEVTNVKDTQCHAIRLMFGACKHLVKEGDIFGEHNLKFASENLKAKLKIALSRCTYISRMQTDIIYWDVRDLSPKLLEESKKGVADSRRVIEIMTKQINQRTDDDVAVIDEFLRSFKFFDQYPDLSRIFSSPSFSMRALHASDIVFREGDIVTHLYILLQGSIQIYSKLKPEPEVFHNASIFGDMSVDHYHSVGSRFVTCSVAENGTNILQIPFENFLQLEKLKMLSIYRSATSFLVEHHCFRNVKNTASLIDEIISGCRILFKSKCDSCYSEGELHERSIWVVLKGRVELILNADSDLKNSDDLVLDIKMNALGKSTNSSARAAFSKQVVHRHSLGVLQAGSAFAPFAVPNSIKHISKVRADHDAVAAENDTIIAVFFMKHSKDDCMTAMSMIEQQIAFLSQWREVRKKAADTAIVQSLSVSTTSPIRFNTSSTTSQRYHTVRPKTGLEGKVDAKLYLPKLAGSRFVDVMHNNEISNVSQDHFAVLSDTSLEELYVKVVRQKGGSIQECSKPCPSPHELIKMEGDKIENQNHESVSPQSSKPDVEKKILNVFAGDKFKRKATPSTAKNDSDELLGIAVAETKHRQNSTTGLSDSQTGRTSSPESNVNETRDKNRDAVMDEIFGENKNVASKIAAIMTEGKFKHNASQGQIESSIQETLQAACKTAASSEPAWKGKVIEILKADVFQRTAEDPENILQHALSVAADLAQKERQSRLPKEKILIDAFCKRVREQMQLGQAVDFLAFDQTEIYVPDPVRSFGRNRISDTAKKIFAQDTQTKFGADEKVSHSFRAPRPQRAASTLLNPKNVPKRNGAVNSLKHPILSSDQIHNINWNPSLNVSKILSDDFIPAKLKQKGLSLARVSTPVAVGYHSQSLDNDSDSEKSEVPTQDMSLQQDDRDGSRQLPLETLKSDSQNHEFRQECHIQRSPILDFDPKVGNRPVKEIDRQKSSLFEYMCSMTQQSSKAQFETKKALQSNRKSDLRPSFSKIESGTTVEQRMPGRVKSDARKTELRLSGEAKITHSVTELSAISRYQVMQAKNLIRTSQYRPIHVKNSPIPSPDDSWKLGRQSLGTYCYEVTSSLDAIHLQANRKNHSTKSMALFPQSLSLHSPRASTIIRKGSPSKPKSREYSSHGISDFALDDMSFPHLNVVNSPSSSKPHTPHTLQVKPWSPKDPSRPSPALNVSIMRGSEFQPHITGIALDDGILFKDIQALRNT